MADAHAWEKAVTFTQPAENAARAAVNSEPLRLNPLFSWQKDADYTVSRTLWGLLSRHDRNAVGASDRLVLGLLGESHRTASFHKWELGWSLVAKHQSDSRRGFTKTALLPWGLLYGQFSAKLPQAPARTISRHSVLWGLGASRTRDSSDQLTFNLLPGGLLFRNRASPTGGATYLLGTGVAHTQASAKTAATTQFRLLGIRVWTAHKNG